MTIEELEQKYIEFMSEAMADGHINDAVMIMETDNGILSLGTLSEPNEEMPKNSLRLVAHWMYHVFTFAPVHRRVTKISIQRKGKKGRVYNA